MLNNGSFENGSTDPVTGHNVQSAASNWWQWINSDPTNGVLTTELVTNSEVFSSFGVHIVDGDRALRITTSGNWDGGYSYESFHNPGWDTNSPLTFSAWVYTIGGTMGVYNGSYQDGFAYTLSSKIGEWEFLSVSITGGRLNNEPLLYSVWGAADFIVDCAWLNYGANTENPTAPVPEPATVWLLGTGIAGLFGTRLRRKK